MAHAAQWHMQHNGTCSTMAHAAQIGYAAQWDTQHKLDMQHNGTCSTNGIHGTNDKCKLHFSQNTPTKEITWDTQIQIGEQY
jgi:hypothetical protein